MKLEEARELFRNDKDSFGKLKAPLTKLKLIYSEFENEKQQLINIIKKFTNDDLLIITKDLGLIPKNTIMFKDEIINKIGRHGDIDPDIGSDKEWVERYK